MTRAAREEDATAPETLEEDRAAEPTLRPRSLEEYVGQDSVRENLRVFIDAVRKRGGALDHVLFSGPPGLGKTTLAHIISEELGVGFHSTSGPVIERPGDLAAILTNLQERDVLFIDEIHRLSAVVEEILYPAMEDFQIDIVIGQGPAARSIKLDLARFTLVGATTRSGLLSSPLRERFGVMAHLEYYKPEELERIITRSARILGIGVEPEGAREIARRARGTPRIANRLLRRVRDFAEVADESVIRRERVAHALAKLDVDEQGLDRMDRRILRVIVEQYAGGPVGIEALSASLNEERDTIEDVYEPFLIQLGFLQRTARGRIASEAAYKHLGLEPRRGAPQSDLFGRR